MKNNIDTLTTVRVAVDTLDQVNKLVTVLLANLIIDFTIHKNGYVNKVSVNYVVVFSTKNYLLVDELNKLNWIK